MSGTVEIPAHHKNTIPPAVRRIAENADRLFHEQAQVQAAEGEQQEQQEQPAAEAPQQPVAEQQAPPAPTVGQPSAEQVDWEHKFNSLKGKHDAEMARMQAQVEGLQRVIAGMQQSIQAPPPAGPGASVQPDDRQLSFDFKPFTKEEVDDYGEEFLSVAERAAARRFAPVLKQLTDRIAQLENGVQTVATTVNNDARAGLYKMLNEQVPDWEAQDRDPLFLNWLAQPDPFSGVPRQVLLDNAMKENNGSRVVAFFKAYKDMQATPSAPASPPPSPQPAARQPRTSLETLAAPGRGRPGTPSATPAQTGSSAVYSQTQIAKFYEDVRRGMYRNNPAERARIEADIVKAATEGRVRAG